VNVTVFGATGVRGSAAFETIVALVDGGRFGVPSTLL
jgi:hypothetical protein